MGKCEFCGNEVDFPFSCPYCHKGFCPEHRHPESHQCSDLPRDPLFWYRKKVQEDEQFLRDAQHGYEFCPKCHSYDVGVWGFDAKEVNYQCNICHHSWIGKRTEVPPREFKIPKEKIRKELEKRKKRRWFF